MDDSSLSLLSLFACTSDCIIEIYRGANPETEQRYRDSVSASAIALVKLNEFELAQVIEVIPDGAVSRHTDAMLLQLRDQKRESHRVWFRRQSLAKSEKKAPTMCVSVVPESPKVLVVTDHLAGRLVDRINRNGAVT
jgi:hypothetical protein